MNVRFATPYNDLPQERHELFRTFNTEESLTQQSDKNSTDINIIMSRYQETGLLPQLTTQGLHGDFSEITDFHDAQKRILEAKEAFLAVPAKIRERFHHNPQEFIEFVENPANAEELRKMGLANAPPTPQNAAHAPTPAPQPRYDDDGEHYDYEAERTAGNPRQQPARGTHPGTGDGRQAVREREGLRTPSNREPR